MANHVRPHVNGQPSESPLSEEVRQVRFPFVIKGIIRALSVEQNTAMRNDRPVLFAIRNEVRWVDDGLRCMNGRFIPIGIGHSCAAIPKMNWNPQPFRNEARIMSLILIQPIYECCEGVHFTIR